MTKMINQQGKGFSVISSRPVQTVAVTSGKGGVGKTQLAMNLAVAFAELGQRVAVMDGDLGLGNVHLVSGLQAGKDLADVIAGRADLQDILLEGPAGVRVIPAPAALQPMTALSTQQHAALIHQCSVLSGQVDLMIIDTASGISEAVTNLASASQEVVVVICPEAASIAHAHALINLLNHRNVFRFRILVNMIRSAQEGKKSYEQLRKRCDESMDVALHYMGHIPFDDNLRIAAQQQRVLLDLAPRSRAARALCVVAEKLLQLPPPAVPSGKLEFFVEQLLQPRR